MFNWAKYYAILDRFENTIGKDIPKSSGIYLWSRWSDRKQKMCYYVGQAINLFQRRFQYYQIQCGLKPPGKRHFERSLKVHKEWKFEILELYKQEEFDTRPVPQELIKEWLNKTEQFYIQKYIILPNSYSYNRENEEDKIVRINAKRIAKVEKNLKNDIAKLLKRVGIDCGKGRIIIIPKRNKNGSLNLNSIKALLEIEKWIKELTNNEK